MKDKSKRLTVVNTGKKPSEKKEVQQIVVQPSSSSSSHAPGFNPNLYLLKSVWDSVFEIKTDGSGQKYIFGKLPVVTKYGITMYADDGNVDIPQLAEGLPFDQRTIWFNPETKQIEVIGGTGGGEGGVSNFWDLSGIPSWITNSKPIYSYSEIKNTPDLSVFITDTELGSTLADYATLSYLTGELKEYVTLDGEQDITGVKDFINGLKIGGLPITKKQGDVVYLDANLVVRGGITMYGDGEGGSSVPLYSTLGSLLNVDESNDAVASVDRVLFQSAGSNVWSWKPLSEIGGGSVSGDYLPLANAIYHTRTQNPDPNTKYDNWMGMSNKNTPDGANYYHILSSTWDNMYWSSQLAIPTVQSSNMYYRRGATTSAYNSWVKLLDENNYSSYALPLSGGTIKGLLSIRRDTSLIHFGNSGTINYGYLGFSGVDNPVVYMNNGTTNYNLLHSGNISSYNAGSATKLQTARTIWGQSFDGSGNVSGDIYLKKGFGILDDAGIYWIVGIDSDTHGTVILGRPNSPTLLRGTSLSIGEHIYLTGVDSSSSVQSTSQLIFGTSSSTKVAVSAVQGMLVINPSSSSTDGQSVLGVNGNDTYFTSSGKFIVGGSSGYGGHKLSLYGSMYTQNGIATGGNIIPVEKAKHYLGVWGQYFEKLYVSSIYTGSNSNELWLVSGKNSNNIGVVFGRKSTDSESSTELARINAYGLVFKDVAGIMSPSEVQVRLENLDSSSIVLVPNYFKPYIAANRNVSLGRWDSQWKRIYVSDNPASTTASGLTFCDSSGKGLGTVGNSSGDLGIYAKSDIYLRPSCTSAADGEVHSSGLGVVISSSGLTCSGGITMYSDQRKKTILNHVELSLKQIADAPLIEHYYNSDQDKTTHVGSIAQYWAGINDWFCKLDNEGFYTMEIQNCALASAISIARELDRYETKTDKTIRKMKQRIQELEDEVERLKQN